MEMARVTLEESIDLGIPMWQPIPGTQRWSLRKPFAAMDSLGIWTRFVHTEGRVVAVDGWHGLLLVFNAERGNLERVCTLFGRDIADLSSEDEFAVLGVQPCPDGQLLLASRSMDAVLFSRKVHPTSGLGATVSAWQVGNYATHQRSLDAYPDVLWWEFRPDGGTFHPVATPEGLPSRLLKPELLSGFRFLMGIDGKPQPSTLLVAPPKPETAEAAGVQ